MEEIQKGFTTFYQKLYQSQHHMQAPEIQDQLKEITLPSLTESQKADLNKPFLRAEIEQAIFQIGALKAPGPDGIPAGFYQLYWSIVQNDVISTIQAFFHLGYLLKSLNHTFLSLIPKVACPEEFSQFRPISLCNVAYKIISKVLVNRLKPIMDSLITPFQNAFIQGRLITDNILLAHKIYDYMRKKKKDKWGFGALKLDMQKARDRIEWSFLKAVLHNMGFSTNWIHWVMQCVSTVSYHILINASPSKTIVPSRGLRQGDPLSPYLFILCANVLSCALIRSEQNNNIKGIRIG